MKAIRIRDYGNFSALHHEDVPLPRIAEDEVLVRVVASSINPVDSKIREGSRSRMDTLGGETQERSWSVLRPDGLLVSIAQPPSEERAKALGKRGAFVFTSQADPSSRSSRPLSKAASLGP